MGVPTVFLSVNNVTSHLIGVTEVTTSPVTIDNTNKPSCGISDDMEQATNANGCDLTHQPCFYTLTVTNVFKGNMQVIFVICNFSNLTVILK